MPHVDRVAQRLKLRDLHCMMIVAEARSLSKAARSLGVSQPVLSKTIAELETLLGARLFDRSPQGVEPTAQGRHMLVAGHAIFDELKLGVEEIEHLSDPAAGELSIGSNEASTIGIVPATIERLRKAHPKIRVNVVLVNTLEEQRKALVERRVDFAIGRLSDSPQEDIFETERLFDQRQVVVAGRQNAWAARQHVALAELLEEPWVLPAPETASGRLAAEVFRASGLEPPKPRVVTSSFLLNRGLLERGLFLALMPETILPLVMTSSKLRRVAVDLPRQVAPVGVTILRGRVPSPLAGRFLALARGIAKR